MNLLKKQTDKNSACLIVFSLKHDLMKIIYTCLLAVFFLTACSRTYYVVRHAEKETQGPNMTSDVPLSEAGRERAKVLSERLASANIKHVFSTNTQRTRQTVEEIARQHRLPVEIYGPIPSDQFIDSLRHLKGNILVVGHSNTVDDIVNGLTGTRSVEGDLRDSEYNNLFVVKIKGKKASFKRLTILPDIKK